MTDRPLNCKREAQLEFVVEWYGLMVFDHGRGGRERGRQGGGLTLDTLVLQMKNVERLTGGEHNFM